MALITFKTFDNAIDAHQLKNKLESEGIVCYLFDEYMVSINPIYSNSVGGIKLKIDDEDFESAKELLSQLEQVPLTNDNGSLVTCPRCSSSELYLDFKSMKGASGIASIFISFLLMVFPIYYKTVYKCKACGTEFKKV